MSMDDVKKSTKEKTINQTKCVKGCKVTDQFQKMVLTALKAQRIVLHQRALDLKTWEEKEKNEFLEIFGIEGSVEITIDSKEEKADAREKENGSVDNYIEKRSITAHEFMKESVQRLIYMCDQLYVDDAKEGDERHDKKLNANITYGSFINRTEDHRYTAGVCSDQTLTLAPERYKEELKINIYQRFTNKVLTGVESQVSTLCHELSHFFREGEKGELGGMGTYDMRETAGGSYLQYAKELKKKSSQLVFRNAYNIELYFGLAISDEELEQIKKEVDKELSV